MSMWNFKTIQSGSKGAEFVELSLSQQERVKKYTEALEIAAASTVANPPFSKYFVKESIGTRDGCTLLPAGNIEYGLCQALHGEESAVAAFRSYYGRNKVSEPILGIIAGSPGNIASPCGNCRDLLLDEFGEDFEIVSGAPEGGLAIVAKMKDYLFSQFRLMHIDHEEPILPDEIKMAIKQGELLANDFYSPPDVHPERRYHAMIATVKNFYVGARDVMCEYHPIYALRDAIRQARRGNDPFVESVTIVCEDFDGGAPHVMYKDRQHLLELNLQAELLLGVEQNPPVYLVTYGQRKEIVGAWKTSVKEWLPFPFDPRNFGPEFVKGLTDYYSSLGF